MAFKKNNEKTGPCVKNRNGKIHEKQITRNRVSRRRSGQVCVKDSDGDPIKYDRIDREKAEELTSSTSWEYCSKREYKDRHDG